MKLFVHQVFMLTLLLLSMLVQFQFVWPLESKLLDYTQISVASLLFIPHGLRAIFIVLMGARAFIPIFFAHLMTDLMLGMSFALGALSGTAAVVAMAMPLLMINFLSQKPVFEPLVRGNTENLSLFRLVIVTAAISSLLNGAIGAMRYESSVVELVAFRYFIGDMLGAVVVLAGLVLVKKPLLSLGRAFNRP